MCTEDKKLCFSNDKFIYCEECKKLFNDYKKYVRPNAIPCGIDQALDEICDVLGFAYHYENTMYTGEDIDYTIKRFIESEEFDDYCYMKYIDIFIDYFDRGTSIGELHGLMLETYKIALIYLLDVMYGEKDIEDNELYQIYLENKPKTLSDIQIKHKYVGNTEYKTKTNNRRGQDELRKLLLDYYGKCNVTGITIAEFLEVSHSKPWSQCIKDNDNNELDVYNTFLLVKHISVAYDKGYISFDDNGKILISSKLDDFNKKTLNIHDDMNISIEEGHLKYLEYHRANIFKQ